MSKYSKTSPKKNKTGGHVGSKITQTGVDQGQHTIVVTEIVDASWSKKELIVGEDIEANVETSGFKDGTEITFEIFETDPNSPDIRRETLTKKLSGNKAKLTWKYPESIVPKNKASSQYSVASVYFTVYAHGESQMSNEIPVYSDLNIKVEKEDSTPISQVEVVIIQSDGKISFHNTDSSGMVSVKKLPPRNHKVKFTGSSRIVPEGEKIVDFSSAPQERNIVALGNKIHVFKLLELYAYCSHKVEGKRRSVGNIKVFEVVPDNIGKDAYKDEVMILSRTATDLQSNGKNLEKKEDEFGMHAFLLKCEQEFKGVTPNILKGDFWSGLVKPKEYPISGLPSPLTIKCYRPDIYKLQIKFPEMGKWSGGFQQQASASEVINSVKQKKPVKFERSPLTKSKGWDLKTWPERVHSDKNIIFQRNGALVDAKFYEYVGAIIVLANKLSQIVSFVQDNVPKIGFYFAWECQVFQGTFVVEWGWKEYKDQRAYYYIGVNLDVKIIEVKLEIGVGVSGFAFKIQIYGALNGSVTLSAKLCRYSPEGEAELSIPFGAEIIGSLGARAEAGCFVKMEGTVETGIKLEDGAFKFKENEGVSIGCTLKWSGLVGKLKISAGTAKKSGIEENRSPAEVAKEGREEIRPYETDEKASSTYEHELIGSSDLGKWQWPDPKAEYNPPVIPREDLHKMLVKKLTEGENIRVKIGEGWVLNRYMDMDKVAKEIEDKIHERNEIRKDPKTAEALVFDIRNRLEEIIHEIDSGSHLANMSKERFELFLNGGELKRRLNKYIDPIQDIINKNT